MGIRVNYSKDPEIARLQRKRDQEFELAGCARHDSDKVDEMRHLEKAEEYKQQIKEFRGED
jgi:hypothetical protein